MKCQECRRELDKKGNRKKFCSRPCVQKFHNRIIKATYKERAETRKLYFLALSGNKCSGCGYNRNYTALEFHHTKKNKELKLDARGLATRSISVLMKEWKKCRLLCANCHREEHEKDGGLRPQSRKKKQKLMDLCGGGCEKCGYHACITALEFHHRDATEKKFGIGLQLHKLKIENLMKEAAKCCLLCANCHREEHYPNALIRLSRTEIENSPYLNFKTKPVRLCRHCKRKVTSKNKYFCHRNCYLECNRHTSKREEPKPRKREISNQEPKRRKRKFEVTKDRLIQLIWEMPMTAVGRLFQVSDNAIRKRCRSLAIPLPPSNYWKCQKVKAVVDGPTPNRTGNS